MPAVLTSKYCDTEFCYRNHTHTTCNSSSSTRQSCGMWFRQRLFLTPLWRNTWTRFFGSTETVNSRELRKGSIILQKGVYCEVRSARPAGHGRSASGGFEIRYRELHNRKAREVRMSDSASVVLVECDRAKMPVLYKDLVGKRLVLADSEYNELSVSLAQVGDAADALNAGAEVSVLTHEGNIVKIVPPPEIAEALQQEHRRARREQLQARQVARHGGPGKPSKASAEASDSE
ncbi:unnamed protein product [Polarella glacialis]|uniref:Translation elongation factor P/YeiP central domain-containing protein n=1 Tax=Polarella glacialis TaxID=89957 RepID=A0A813DFE8_POLGL|nr:unnamed protein product [Polarella glacialis]